MNTSLSVVTGRLPARSLVSLKASFSDGSSSLKTLEKPAIYGLKASHPEPANKLSPDERSLVLDTLHSSEFVDTSPNEIVAMLADRGVYIASERTFYRILKQENESHHRGRSKSPVKRDPPSHVATAPKVWSWDITYLNGPIKGHYFFLYMILDIFSRFIVGWEVWEEQSSEHAKTLVSKAALAEHIDPTSTLVLHSDNGSPMKAYDMLAKLQQLVRLSRNPESAQSHQTQPFSLSYSSLSSAEPARVPSGHCSYLCSVLLRSISGASN